MKIKLLKVLTAITLLLIPIVNYGQAPTLGTVANYVLFTSNGAMTNSGVPHLTHLTGNVGSNLAGAISGFGNVDGQMHVADPSTAACVADLTSLYNQMNLATTTFSPVSPILGNGDTLIAGVYQYPLLTPASVNLNLFLDAQGNPNAVFIIKIGGALSVNTLSKVILANGAKACNVFWKVEGLVSMAPGVTMRGNIVANNAAINMSTFDTLEGRALSINGAVSVSEILAYTPIGCGSAILTGPAAPALDSAGKYGVFASIGSVSSTPITYVNGNVGSNSTISTGFNPLYVTGTIHTPPDASTGACAAALLLVYNYLNALSADINLLDPPNFGYDLVLTPHTYLLGAATMLTDSVFLNAENDANAVFIIKVTGSFTTNTFSYVKLINGTQAKNVYWLINGAVHIYDNSNFNGQIIASGAITLNVGDTISGRVLTLNGGVAINGSYVFSGAFPVAGNITGDSTVCVGSNITLTDVDTGGTWSSTNARATVSGGVVRGITSGMDTIKYTVISGGDTAIAKKAITINPVPNAGNITGNNSTCIGSVLVLSDIITGGTWGRSNARATVISGTVTPVSAGMDTIRYIVTNSCGTDTAIKPITIGTTRDAGAITGGNVVCTGHSLILNNTTTGGTWGASNTNATVLSGTVTPVSLGMDTIMYLFNNGCGLDTVILPITINHSPNAGIISGLPNVCAGSVIALSSSGDSVGFTWNATNLTSIVTSYGAVLGISNGIDTIMYIVSNSCGADTATKTVITDSLPNAGVITGGNSICVGTTLLLIDTAIGGVWSSTNYRATVLAGTVTPVSTGIDTIRYIVTNACGGDTATKNITINPLPDAGSILGVSNVCIGFTISLTDAVTGGAWSRSNANATVIGGVVRGVTGGMDTIRYEVINGCGTDTALKTIIVNTIAGAGSITGSSSVCIGATITLADTVSSGIWSCSNAHATISGGVVRGITAGTDTVWYALTNTCGTDSTSKIITINTVPNTGIITGASSVCIGSSITLADGITGGIWVRSNTKATVSGGVIRGVTAGIDTIGYSVTNTCGTDTALKAITIVTFPNAGSITGISSVCAGSSITLTDISSGGIWGRSNTKATVAGDVVTGVTAGLDTIMYIVTNVCGADTAKKVITIAPLPDAGTITGASSVCVGSNITLTDIVAGGIWGISNTKATITTGGVVRGVTAGIDTIRYAVSNSCGIDTAMKIVTMDVFPNAGGISGSASVCADASITLTDAAIGGVWSSSNTKASISGDVVTGVTVGTDTIRYVVTNACGADTATKSITINSLHFAASIIGASSVCLGSATTLTDIVTGGLWSSSNASATVAGGVVTGVIAGIDTIRYAVTNSCGIDTVMKTVTTDTFINAGTISGLPIVCAGASITLTDVMAGGTWHTSNTAATVFGDVVTGVRTGTDTIKYIVANACDADTATMSITIDTLPFAGHIIGLSSVCIGSSITLTDSTSFGSWTSSNNNDTVYQITIGGIPAGGIVTGIIAGIDTVIYSVSNNCGIDTVTKIIRTDTAIIVASITGLTNVCVGSSITLADTDTGGIWRSSNLYAFVSANIITGNIAGIDTIIYSFINACGSALATKAIIVDALPFLISTDTPSAICDSALFSYIPISSISGASFIWDRSFVIGISNPNNSGTSGIDETLDNITNMDINVAYTYTIIANGCSNIHDVNVTVYPTPILANTTDTVCNNVVFSYTPVGLTAGTSFAWSRNIESNVSGGTFSGINDVNQILVNSSSIPVNVVFIYTLTLNSCIHVEDVSIIISPSVSVPAITTSTPASICSGTQFQAFSAATPPMANIKYSWSVINAIKWATSTNGQNTVVNFPYPGNADVIFSVNYVGFSCLNSITDTVAVGIDTAQTPKVLYFESRFVCTPATEDSYQWGYDDFATLVPTTLAGEINQDYINADPNLTTHYYWVITTKNGCVQKTYYNPLLGVQNINMTGVPSMEIYPNPSDALINVLINTNITGKIEIRVSNMTGQVLSIVNATDDKAIINVAEFPTGLYMVNSYCNGVKIAGTRFVKD